MPKKTRTSSKKSAKVFKHTKTKPFRLNQLTDSDISVLTLISREKDRPEFTALKNNLSAAGRAALVFIQRQKKDTPERKRLIEIFGGSTRSPLRRPVRFHPKESHVIILNGPEDTKSSSIKNTDYFKENWGPVFVESEHKKLIAQAPYFFTARSREHI